MSLKSHPYPDYCLPKAEVLPFRLARQFNVEIVAAKMALRVHHDNLCENRLWKFRYRCTYNPYLIFIVGKQFDLCATRHIQGNSHLIKYELFYAEWPELNWIHTP